MKTKYSPVPKSSLASFRILVLSLAALLALGSRGLAASTLVADFKADFQPNTPKTGWTYLWNDQGAIGTETNYTVLTWNSTYGVYDHNGTVFPGVGNYFTPGNVHPGNGTGNPGITHDRFVITRYTVSSAGVYEIVNLAASDQSTAPVDYFGFSLFVNVNSDTPLLNQVVGEGAAYSGPSTISLGLLAAGDDIYVAIGPNQFGEFDSTSLSYQINRVTSVPSIAVSGTLSPFATTVGTPSAAQSFTVGGANLTANLTVTAPSGFEVSTDNVGFGPVVSLAPVAGVVPSTTIHLRLGGQTAGTFSSPVTLASTGATETLAASGTVPFVADFQADLQANTPKAGWTYLWNDQGPIGNEANYTALTWNSTYGVYDHNGTVFPGVGNYFTPGNVHPGNGTGNPGITHDRFVITRYTVSSAGVYEIVNLAASDQSTAPVDYFGFSLFVNVNSDTPLLNQVVGEGAAYSGPSTISLGLLAAGDDIYVAIGPNQFGEFDSTSLSYQINRVTSVPSIAVSGTLSPFATTVGTPSAAQSFTVGGANLTANLTVTAPSGFEVSTDNVGFGPVVSLAPVAGVVPSTTIHLRLGGQTAGTFSSPVTLASTGATETLAASGTVQTLYQGWLQGAPSSPANQTKYALGGAPDASSQGTPIVPAVTTTHLTITAIVRTNDTNLSVVGQGATNLTSGLWSSHDVTMTIPVDQSGAVPGTTQRQIFSTPSGGETKKFLRLQTVVGGQNP